MNRIVITGLLTGLALATANAATPAPTPTTPAGTNSAASDFDRADTNHDGNIARDEFKVHTTLWFRNMDVDGDDYVRGAEFEADQLDQFKKMNSQVVAGIIKAEFLKYWSGTADLKPIAPAPATLSQTNLCLFQTIDTNNDGKISRHEFALYMSRQFDAMDANHDGKLSLDEFMTGRMKIFRAMDTDHDDIVFPPEFDAYELGKPTAAPPTPQPK